MIVTTVGGGHLAEQLRALAAQSQPIEDLVVVNNGAPGAVTAVIDEWRKQLPSLRLVEDRFLASCGYARNAGAAASSEPGLLFLDDDDVVHPEYVAAMSRALDEAPMVAARIDLDALNSTELADGCRGLQESGPVGFHDFLPWAFGGAFGVHRELFERVGGYDTSLKVCEDTDICWRAQLDGAPPPIFQPESVLSYRLRATPRAAFRQAMAWGHWEVELQRRYQGRGLPRRPSQLRALLRWGRPLIVLLRRRDRPGVVTAARFLGERVGRLQGSVTRRYLYL